VKTEEINTEDTGPEDMDTEKTDIKKIDTEKIESEEKESTDFTENAEETVEGIAEDTTEDIAEGTVEGISEDSIEEIRETEGSGDEEVRVRPKKKRRIGRWIRLGLLALLAVIAVVLGVFFFTYYHADETALLALESDDEVTVSETDYGYFFDGKSTKDVLIFYPGARVEETAYAPLLRRIAEMGADVCLVKMPLRFAIFGINKADDVVEKYDYENWYIGGHSLGGAMAAKYAAKHQDKIKGVLLLAAYSVDTLGRDQKVVICYGDQDKIVNMKKIDEIGRYALQYSVEVIPGGNHAQFGNYGFQRSDGTATISAELQQQLAVECFFEDLVE